MSNESEAIINETLEAIQADYYAAYKQAERLNKSKEYKDGLVKAYLGATGLLINVIGPSTQNEDFAQGALTFLDRALNVITMFEANLNIMEESK